MSILVNSAILIVLFAVLGFSADMAVKNIRYIASALKMKLFTLGIVLGIATTMPEMSIGINASLRGVGGLSVGNILGGIAVIIGLILGLSLILHKGIDTDGNLKTTIPALAIVTSPFFLGFDGRFSIIDGLIMILLYLALVFYLYKQNETHLGDHFALVEKKKIVKSLFLSLVGIIIVILSSSWTIEFSSRLLEKMNISKLLLGMLVFSIGTNLPEITIALTSWRRKASELSISYLTSSAFTNILVLGILSILKPISFSTGIAYYSLAFFLTLIMSLFILFSYSNKKLSRTEGFILLGVYFAFLITNIILAGK